MQRLAYHLIHDGVRPFIDEPILQQSIDLAATGVGALVAVQTKDTIKVVQNGAVISTPERSTSGRPRRSELQGSSRYLAAHHQALAGRFSGNRRLLPAGAFQRDGQNRGTAS